jgi:hypothetical protein
VHVVGFYLDVVQVLETENITTGSSAMGLRDEPTEKEP